MKRYLDPKADIPFKRVFGEHKDLLISLLNSLLPLPEGKCIVSLEYLSPELVPELPDKKNSIVDVRCKDADGRQFIVEMQMYWTRDFLQRSLLNTCKAYSRVAKRGEKYEALNPVYTLCLLNDEAFAEYPDDFYFEFVPTERHHSDLTIDDIRIILVELPKFMTHKGERSAKFPSAGMMKRLAVLWMRFLTEINERTLEVPAELLNNTDVAKAIDIVEESAYSEAELLYIDKFWDAVSCERSLMQGSYKEGHAEGRAEEKVAIALQMKADGMPVDMIVKYTGLSDDEVKKL